MERSEEKSVPLGLNFSVTLPSGTVQTQCARLQTVKSFVFGDWVSTRKVGKRKMALSVVTSFGKFPLRIQTSPLLISRVREMDGRFLFGILTLDYKSNRNPAAASQFLDQMKLIDLKVEKYLEKNREHVWPNEMVSGEEAKQRYRGFSKDKVWMRAVEEKVEENVGLAEATVEEKNGSLSLVYEPGVSLKRKSMEESREEVVLPAALDIFPTVKNRKYTCKILDTQGRPIPFKTLKEGMEVVAVFDVYLTAEKGYINANASGLQINVKAQSPSELNLVASEMCADESVQ